MSNVSVTPKQVLKSINQLLGYLTIKDFRKIHIADCGMPDSFIPVLVDMGGVEVDTNKADSIEVIWLKAKPKLFSIDPDDLIVRMSNPQEATRRKAKDERDKEQYNSIKFFKKEDNEPAPVDVTEEPAVEVDVDIDFKPKSEVWTMQAKGSSVPDSEQKPDEIFESMKRAAAAIIPAPQPAAVDNVSVNITADTKDAERDLLTASSTLCLITLGRKLQEAADLCTRLGTLLNEINEINQ